MEVLPLTLPRMLEVFLSCWITFLALLVCWRLILPIKFPLKFKLFLSAVYVLWVTASVYTGWFTGGNALNSRLTRLPQQVICAGYFSALFIVFFLVLRGLINLLWKLLRRSRHALLLSPSSRTVFVAVFCAAAGLGAFGVKGGFAEPETVVMDFTLPKLPAEAEPFKIAVLADLHICQSATAEELQKIVARTNALKPDLIVIVGDFVDDSISELDPLTSTLAALNAPHGIFAVSGNHEFYAGYAPWLSYFEKQGVRFLENRSVVVKSAEGRPLFNLAGVMDVEGAAHFNLPGPQPEQALQEIDPLLPVVYLTHRPGALPAEGRQPELVFAGHTHGGCAPLIRQVVALANRGMVSGLYEHEGSSVLVTNGTRLWAGFCLRILTPPQLILARLHVPASS